MIDQNHKSLYSSAEPILVAVDCIIFGFDNEGLKLLLFKRQLEPFLNEWSLIGSFVRKGESTSHAALRVLEETTGLRDVFLQELGSFSTADRDPGDRVISIASYALIRLEEQQEQSVKDYQAAWIEFDQIPDLIMDHEQMIQDALERLREHAQFHPIGFELLPKKFTLPQLLFLYESIYQKPLDRRNFRKKILSMKILEKLEEKDKSNSKKGAFLYRFDEKKYKKLMARGLVFSM